MALADLKRSWLLKQLGLSSSTLTELDLLNQLYSNQQTSEMEGNGSPEGVVAAPVGSTYIDRQGTNGAIQWIKKSGTGNTGWVVGQGDTGWRNVSGLLTNGWAATIGPSARLRRINNVVYLTAYFDAAVATANEALNLDVGFRSATAFAFPCAIGTAMPGTSATVEVSTLVRVYRGASTSTFYTNGSWPTNDAWPSSLPGAAAP